MLKLKWNLILYNQLKISKNLRNWNLIPHHNEVTDSIKLNFNVIRSFLVTVMSFDTENSIQDIHMWLQSYRQRQSVIDDIW